MRARKFGASSLIALIIISFVAYRLQANSHIDGVTTTLPNGLVVTAIQSPQPDWSARLFGGAVYRFHIHNPEPRRMLNAYVETVDKNLKPTVAAGLGVAPVIGQPGIPEVDCTIAIVPFGNSLMDSEKIQVTILINGASSVSPIVNNPFFQKNQNGPPGTFGTYREGMYNANGAWAIMAYGAHGITTGPKFNDLTMVVRFDTSPPVTVK